MDRLRFRAGEEGANFLPVRLCANTVSMASQETVQTRKRRGPKPTGKGVNVGVRLQPDQLAKVDQWRERQDDTPTRPEAIRRLVEKAL